MVAKTERSVMAALWRGTACKCPRCGKGKMFGRWLKVADKCDHCGEVLGHARADDFPPYISITIVGHIIVAVIMHLEMTQPLSPMTYMITAVPASILMTLLVMQPVKGFVVGLQWAMGMYGFAPGAEPRADSL